MADIFIKACYTAVMLILCFLSSFYMLRAVSRGIYMRKSELYFVCIFLIIFAFCYSVITDLMRRRGRTSSIISMVIIYISSAAALILFMVRLTEEDRTYGKSFLSMIFDDAVDKETFYLYKRYRFEYLLGASKLLALYFTAAILVLFAVSFILKKYCLMAGLPIAAAVTAFAYGYSPDYKAFMLLILLAAVIKLVSIEADKALIMPENSAKGRLHLKKGINGLAGIFLAAILLFIAIPLSKEPEKLMKQNSAAVREFQKNLENRLKGYAVSEDYSNIRKINNNTPDETGREVLSLKMSEAPEGDIYLKDFSAMNYAGSSWKIDEDLFEVSLPESIRVYDARRILAGRLYKYYDDNAKNMITNITISYRGKATSAALPSIYDPNSFDEGYFISEDTAVKDRNTREYMVRAVRYNNISQNDVINYNMDFLSYSDMAEYNLSYSNMPQYEMSDTERDFWRWYNRYAYEKYTNMPNELGICIRNFVSDKQQLQAYYDEFHMLSSLLVYDNYETSVDYSGYGNEERMKAAEYVAAVFQGGYEYSKKPDKLKSGEDPVEYFIAHGKKGYCVHFASAGVLILRYLGIPARYVSGYRVDYDSIRRDKDGGYSASVTDSDAHAWIEIYLDNLGWIPVEMTPGMGGEARRTDSGSSTEKSDEPTTVITEKTEKPYTTEISTEKTSINTTETVTADKTGDNGKNPANNEIEPAEHSENRRIIIAAVIVFLGGIMVAVGAIIIYRVRQKRMINNALNGGFFGQQGRYRLLFLNQQLERMMRRKNKTGRRKLSDEEYAEELVTAYPEVESEEWGKYLEILQRINYTEDCLNAQDMEAAEICSNIFNSTLRR